MIQKGSNIIANFGHFDSFYGDIFIDSGDKFEVVDVRGKDICMKPADTHKYMGEDQIHSHEDFFNEIY